MTTPRERWKWLLRAAACGQLLLLASLLWLAADREAHEHVHPDADKSEHECAVTLFAHGKTDLATSAPLVFAAPQTFFFLPTLRLVTVTTVPAHLLPFACGPPRA